VWFNRNFTRDEFDPEKHNYLLQLALAGLIKILFRSGFSHSIDHTNHKKNPKDGTPKL